MAIFKCKGCNKNGFTSQRSLASHHQHRKQCKTLHYSVVLTNAQMSKIISPTAQSLTPLLRCPDASIQTNINPINNTVIEEDINCLDMDNSGTPYTYNDDSDIEDSTSSSFAYTNEIKVETSLLKLLFDIKSTFGIHYWR